MEKEKLIIKNFGPIKEVELDLGRVTVLIGEQATGKSTIAKVLAVCRYFSYIYEEAPSLHFDYLGHGLKQWGLSEYLNEDTSIHYTCKHYSLSYECFTYPVNHLFEGEENTTELLIDEFTFNVTPLSIEFTNLITEADKIKPDTKNNDNSQFPFGLLGNLPTSFYLNDVKKVMDNPFYFPTQRGLQSIFDIGQASIKNLSNSLFNQFSRLDGVVRLFKNETHIEPLGIYYVNRNGHGFIRKANEEKFYSLYNAASGYQSMIPIVLVVKYYNEIKKKAKTLIIEEPELDVFPTAQHKLVQYLVEMSKVHNSMLLMTTHSPYTLTSLNNLMYAYQVGQTHPEKVNKITDKKYWINPADVSAYMMKTDGTCENIIDIEEGMIVAEKIDEVSKTINREFNELMNIELGIDAENN